MEEENKDQRGHTIYKITCLANGRVYVGATGQTVEKRFDQHWNSRHNHEVGHQLMRQDMCVFGRDAFMVETLEDGIAQSEARHRETYWIRWHQDNGYDVYNELLGGGGVKLTDEQKKLICELYANGWGIKKIGKKIGVGYRTVGRALEKCKVDRRDASAQSEPVYCVETNTVYESVREAARQLCLDPRNISKCCRNKDKSRSAGGIHFCFLKDKDNFVIKKPKAGRPPKKVLCVELGIVYESVAEAARQLGLSPSSISSCCHGRYESVGKFHFEYTD